MGVLKERLSMLVDYLKILRDLSSKIASATELARDPLLRGAVERYLHLAVEIIIDIGMRICSLKGLGKPERYRDLAILLHRAGILSEEKARELDLWIGFRNVLVHMYARIDLLRVLDALHSINELEDIAKELAEGVEKLGLDPPKIVKRDIKKLVETIKDVLEVDSRVRLAYVFGSWAEGKATSRSDVDVAIYVSGDLGWRDYVALKNKLEDATGRAVDLIVLNNAPPALAYRVITQGEPILITDRNLMADVETRIMREWLDLKPRLEAYFDTRVRRLRAHRFN